MRVSWLRPIPWLRWLGATALIGIALTVDLRGSATVPYPFAAVTIEAGTSLDAIVIDYRDVPTGLLPRPDLSGRLILTVKAGAPLVPSMFGSDPLVPSEWWIVDLPMSGDVSPGTRVRVVITDPPHAVTGIVTGHPIEDPLAGGRTGPVAVPPDSAELVAQAAAAGNVVALVSATAVTPHPDFPAPLP